MKLLARRIALAALLAACAALAAPAQDAAPAPDAAPSLLGGTNPQADEANRLAYDGTEAAQAGRLAEALEKLERAVTLDPLLAAAWTNLSAALLESCRPAAALFASHLALVLDPADEAARDNHEIAKSKSCPDEVLDAVAAAEQAVLARGGAAEAWAGAAQARRGRGDHLVAVLYEEQALRAGAARAATMARVARDFEAARWFRAAAEVYATLDDPAAAEAARKLAEHADAVVPQARRLAREAGWSAAFDADAEQVRAAAAFAESLLARGDAVAAVEAALRERFATARTGRAETAAGVFRLQPGWREFQPPAGTGAPLALLRRFPGDTQLALWAWPSGAGDHAVARMLAGQGAVAAGGWSACDPAPAGLACRVARLEIDLGPEGRAPLRAFLLGPPGEEPSVALLALAGSGGCGAPCLTQAERSVDQQVAGFEVGARAPALPGPWAFPVPLAWLAERPHRESEEPWRSIALDDQLVAELPPGLVSARVGPAFHGEGDGPDTRLWFRGRFVDHDGREVAVGRDGWAGRIELRRGAGPQLEGSRQNPALMVPRWDPGATLVGSFDLGEARELAGTGGGALVAHFKGQAFEGSWLVAQLALGTDLVEVSLPAAAGAGSSSLLWIPLTVRREDSPPPPPIVNVEPRHAVRFDALGARASAADPREGTLVAGEISLAVPKGFKVSVSAAADGFPVTLRSADGAVIKVERLAPSAMDVAAREGEAAAALGLAEGIAWSRPRSARGGELVEAEAAGREGQALWLALLVPRDRALPAFRVTLARGRASSDELWAVQRRLLRDSLRYL
ncbi:MAG: hypothetical protein KBD01_19370 [Acidobacteria bacterium]|nr:hypothetical protein [Acidobacteriota bacterium]